jgi:hypothetical protein
MAIEAQAHTVSRDGNGQGIAADYPKVESFAADVQHHHPGEPVGTIPLSVSETELPHHAGANPNAKRKGS